VGGGGGGVCAGGWAVSTRPLASPLILLSTNQHNQQSTATQRPNHPRNRRPHPQDFRVNLALAEACRSDVDKVCAKVTPGDGRVPMCLREHSGNLSTGCQGELLRLEEREASDVRLDMGLLQRCKDERALFCRAVAPGDGRVFRCMVESMASADFGAGCQAAIMQKLRRREGNWRLDPPLRRACKEDAER